MTERLLPYLLWAALGAVGCLKDTRPSIDRAHLFDGAAPEVKAPQKDRCQAAAQSNHKSCDDSRHSAQVWARRLSPGDMVCLDNGVGEEPNSDCHARAAVMDSGTDRVLLEVRAARPESKWFDRVESQVWFDEGALVDLYLAERGY